MSLIQAIREYLSGCPHLELLTGGVRVDWTEAAGDYCIMPAGEQPGERYMDGTRVNRYSFTLCARRFTEADLERLENVEFLERFARWIEQNDDAGNFPVLDGARVESLSCANGTLFRYDETASTGTYMVQLTMTYERGTV